MQGVHGLPVGRVSRRIPKPTALFTLLWAVAHGWQQVEIARNTRDIETVGRDLHQCLLRFVGKCHGSALGSLQRATSVNNL